MAEFEIPKTASIDFSRPVDTSVVKGKTALVTGGGSGIGLGICNALANNGAFVVICDINNETGLKAEKDIKASGGNAKYIKTDVTSWESQLTAFTEALSISGNQLDIVVPNAGLAATILKHQMDPPGQKLDPSADPIKPPTKVLEVNLLGVYFSVALATHYFRTLAPQRKDPAWTPQLVMISSTAGYAGMVGCLDYNGSKFGVRGMFKAVRLGQKTLGGKMQTNLLAPSFVLTPIHGDFLPTVEKIGIPMAAVEDAAAAVMRCICDDAVDGRVVCVVPSEKTPGDRNFDLNDDLADGDGSHVFMDKLVTDKAFGPPWFYYWDFTAAQDQ